MQARAVVSDGQLSILNAQKRDSGWYKCQASNPLGHDSAVTDLNVVQRPHFIVKPPAHLKVWTIQNITVRCQAAGDPQPTVTWKKINGTMPGRRSVVGADGTLKIWNPKPEDSGTYVIKSFFQRVCGNGSGSTQEYEKYTYSVKLFQLFIQEHITAYMGSQF